MVCVRVDKLFVPKNEIITKSLADKIDAIQNADTIGSFRRGQSTNINFLKPTIPILLDNSECSWIILKNEGARKLYANGSVKTAFKKITI